METLNGRWESMTFRLTRVRYLRGPSRRMVQPVIETQHNETYLYNMDNKAGHENNRTTKSTTRNTHACDIIVSDETIFYVMRS
jgi:hypothetical protein